jgi:hypothetical protein
MAYEKQSPTLGGPCPLMPMGIGGGVIVHGWAWVSISFVHPYIQLQIGVNFLDAWNMLTKKRYEHEACDSERPFICPIPPRLGVGG